MNADDSTMSVVPPTIAAVGEEEAPPLGFGGVEAVGDHERDSKGNPLAVIALL